MTYTTADGRRQLLAQLAQATEELGTALAALGEAYEQLDERSADTLERDLFRPVQGAYGRAQRAHAGFAERHELEGRTFASAPAPAPGQGVKALVDSAVQAATRADGELAELQDSMLPVEVGDTELRAALGEIRRQIGDISARGQTLIRGFGR